MIKKFHTPRMKQFTIEQFVTQSEGQWRSMRTGHSLAFQQFEEIISDVTIERIKPDLDSVIELLEKHSVPQNKAITPFSMRWEADSDWEPDNPSDSLKGECILVPIKADDHHGHFIRSVGYAEAEEATSQYFIASDGTIHLKTIYGGSIAEERIWFVSDNVRCRSSVIRTSEGSGVIQTSFASEIRRITI